MKSLVVRRSILSIFNLTFVALAIVLWLLHDAWGAIIAILVLLLNIAITIAHQMLASKQIDDIVEKTRPGATVIRDDVSRQNH